MQAQGWPPVWPVTHPRFLQPWFLGDGGAVAGALWIGTPRVCSHGQSLSPAGAHAAGQPELRHPLAQCQLWLPVQRLEEDSPSPAKRDIYPDAVRGKRGSLFAPGITRPWALVARSVPLWPPAQPALGLWKQL